MGKDIAASHFVAVLVTSLGNRLPGYDGLRAAALTEMHFGFYKSPKQQLILNYFPSAQRHSFASRGPN